MNMQDNTKSYFYTSLAILFWATAATAFKIALRHTTPYLLLFYSALFSTLIIFFIMIFQKKIHLLKALKLKDLRVIAILGFLNPFGFYVVVFHAYDLLPGQIALTLNFSWPVMLTILSIPILKQQLNIKQIIAVLISFLGVIIISSKGQMYTLKGVNSFGIFLGVLSTFIWATFWLYNVKNKNDTVVKLFLGFAFGTIYTVLFSPLWGGLKYISLSALYPIIYISFFEMGITFVIWLLALKHASNTAKVSNLIFISPFLSLLFLRIFLGEELYLSTFIGLVLIVTGILYQQRK